MCVPFVIFPSSPLTATSGGSALSCLSWWKCNQAVCTHLEDQNRLVHKLFLVLLMVTLHFASEIRINILHLCLARQWQASQPVVLSSQWIDAFIRHYLNEKLPTCRLFCLFFFIVFFLYLINFTTMSVLMMCQWNCPMLGTLAKWWLMGDVVPMKEGFFV